MFVLALLGGEATGLDCLLFYALQFGPFRQVLHLVGLEGDLLHEVSDANRQDLPQVVDLMGSARSLRPVDGGGSVDEMRGDVIVSVSLLLQRVEQGARSL